MTNIPRDNRDQVLVDVKRHDVDYGHSDVLADVDLRRSDTVTAGLSLRDVSKWAKRGLVTFLAGLFFVGVFAYLNLGDIHADLTSRAEALPEDFSQSLHLMQEGQFSEAASALRKVDSNVGSLIDSIEGGTFGLAVNAAAGIISEAQSAKNILYELDIVTSDAISVAETLEELKTNGLNYFINDGEKLLERLTALRELTEGVRANLANIQGNVDELRRVEQFSGFVNSFKEKYIDYNRRMSVMGGAMEGIVDLLDAPGGSRILLMFQNPSEMRPAGGFTGSYGELLIENGQMEDLVVEDIYWPDHSMNFDLQLIPPEPLQHITKDLGARDANWFFNFPDSARTFASLLESSKIYREKMVDFDAVAAVNTKVLGSVMEVVGPVELDEYDKTINAENFLPELQREVEAGQDKQAGENPKRILSVMAPKIIDRMSNLNEDEKKFMLESIRNHFKKKDIMVYADDDRVAKALQKVGLDGSLYDIYDGFFGSYLAVVNANVGGGKTDVFMDQSIDLELDVSTDGSVIGDLTVTRSHSGGNRRDPWYNAVNRNYTKVFTNPGTKMIEIKGNDVRDRESVEDYTSDYSRYGKFSTIHESKTFMEDYNTWKGNEDGKRTFGTWFSVEPQSSETMEMRYKSPGLEKGVSAGDEFTFVFDKQSGARSHLMVDIEAPAGYRWQETSSQTYRYEAVNPDKRVYVTLTLE